MIIALLLLLAVLATTTVFVGLLWRKRRAAERRSAGLVELAARLNALSTGLGDAVDRAHADSLRSLPSVELAVARVEIDGVPLIATAGFEREKAPSRTGVAVPLEVEGRRLGSLTVYGRTGEPPVPGDELDALQAISRRSAPAIGSAPRLEVVARVEPGPAALGDRELFHETLALLAARARRQGDPLAVCVLDLDEFRLVNRRIGSPAADRVIADVSDAIRESVSPTDLACRTGGDEFAIALPGAGRIKAESLAARIQATLARTPSVREARVGVTAGIAELEADDDGVALYQRAAAVLRDAKAAKGTAA
jgi:diguanylate cyclase (GGDEF)-like protein